MSWKRRADWRSISVDPFRTHLDGRMFSSIKHNPLIFFSPGGIIRFLQPEDDGLIHSDQIRKDHSSTYPYQRKSMRTIWQNMGHIWSICGNGIGRLGEDMELIWG